MAALARQLPQIFTARVCHSYVGSVSADIC
jgi:hypothetical protein